MTLVELYHLPNSFSDSSREAWVLIGRSVMLDRVDDSETRGKMTHREVEVARREIAVGCHDNLAVFAAIFDRSCDHLAATDGVEEARPTTLGEHIRPEVKHRSPITLSSKRRIVARALRALEGAGFYLEYRWKHRPA